MGFVAYIGLMLALGTLLGLSAHLYWQGSRQLMPATGGLALLAAYAFALSFNAGFPIVTSIAIAVMAGSSIGLLLPLASHGVSRAEFMLLGLALVEIIHRLAYILSSITGGTNGLSVKDTPWVPPVAGASIAAVIAVLAVLVAVLGWRSRRGAALRIVGASPRWAALLGINIKKYELVIGAIGGSLAAIAGILYALTIQYIHPDDLGMTMGLPALAVGLAIRPRHILLDVIILTLGLFGLRELLRFMGTSATRFAFHDLLVGVIIIAAALRLSRLTDKEDEHLWERL